MEVAANVSFAAIASGGSHTCALTPLEADGSGGQAYCWVRWLCVRGGGRQRQRPADGVQSAVAVSGAGLLQRCGPTQLCQSCPLCLQGYGLKGQLGTGDKQDSPVPVPVADDRAFKAIAAGEGHTCALAAADGRAFCWVRRGQRAREGRRLPVGYLPHSSAPPCMHGTAGFQHVWAAGTNARRAGHVGIAGARGQQSGVHRGGARV